LLLGSTYVALAYSPWAAIPAVFFALLLRPFVADLMDEERSDLFVVGEAMLLLIARRLGADPNASFGFADESDPKRRKFSVKVPVEYTKGVGVKMRDLIEPITMAICNDLEDLAVNGDPDSEDTLLKLFDSETETLFVHSIRATSGGFELNLEAGVKR
jgi:hypothetical protein